MGSVVAAIDCGSNSTRLSIVDAARGALCREMRITRLSEGVDASGALGEAGLARTFEVLEEFARLLQEHDVERGLLVATSAVRDASNAPVFFDGARSRTGLEVRILSGAQEAALSFAGATGDLDLAGEPVLMVDIGGGSTELAVMFDGELQSFSMQLGCVRVSERALGAGVVTSAAATRARAMIVAELDRAFHARPAFSSLVGRVRMVGLAGTVSTLAQMDAGLSDYDRDAMHHRCLTRATVAYWRDRLASESPEQRMTHPGMVRGREDVLAAGLYVLDEIMDRFGVDELLSSESDILDGITASLLDGRASRSDS